MKRKTDDLVPVCDRRAREQRDRGRAGGGEAAPQEPAGAPLRVADAHEGGGLVARGEVVAAVAARRRRRAPRLRRSGSSGRARASRTAELSEERIGRATGKVSASRRNSRSRAEDVRHARPSVRPGPAPVKGPPRRARAAGRAAAAAASGRSVMPSGRRPPSGRAWAGSWRAPPSIRWRRARTPRAPDRAGSGRPLRRSTVLIVEICASAELAALAALAGEAGAAASAPRLHELPARDLGAVVRSSGTGMREDTRRPALPALELREQPSRSGSRRRISSTPWIPPRAPPGQERRQPATARRWDHARGAAVFDESARRRRARAVRHARVLSRGERLARGSITSSAGGRHRALPAICCSKTCTLEQLLGGLDLRRERRLPEIPSEAAALAGMLRLSVDRDEAL